MRIIVNKLWYLVRTVFLWFWHWLVKLLRIDSSKANDEVALQFLKFGLVGISNTVIAYLTYVLSLLLFNALAIFSSIDYLLAQTISFIISVGWAFHWNNTKVFVLKNGEKRSTLKSLLKTYATYSFTGLFLNAVLLLLWIEIFNISVFIAPIINLVITIPLNYIINKYWSFKAES